MAKPKYRKGRLPPFSAIPHALLRDPDIDPYKISTYAVLQMFTDFGSDSGTRISDTRAAGLAHMGRVKFIECRGWLKDRGWLEWTKTQGGINAYLVHSTCSPGEQASITSGGSDILSPVQDATAPPAPPKKSKKTPLTPPQLTENSVLKTEPRGMTANALVGIVVKLGLRGVRPPDWGKQARAAERLRRKALSTQAAVEEACRGMRLRFPWAPPPLGRSEPFDVFTLERHFAEALASAVTQDKLPSDVVERGPRRIGGGGGLASVSSIVEKEMARHDRDRAGD